MIKARLSRRNGSSRLFPDVDWYFWSLFQFGILRSGLNRGTLVYRRIYFNGPLGWTCWKRSSMFLWIFFVTLRVEVKNPTLILCQVKFSYLHIFV